MFLKTSGLFLEADIVCHFNHAALILGPFEISKELPRRGEALCRPATECCQRARYELGSISTLRVLTNNTDERGAQKGYFLS